MRIQRHAVLVGIGRIGRQVFDNLPTEWNITVIDRNLNHLNLIPEQFGERGITKLCEDATSRLVLKEANLQETSLLAIMTGSDEVNLEVLKLAREEFNVEEVFIIQNDSTSDFPFDNITVLNAANLLANRLSNQMSGELVAAGVGLEQGEIRQVSVLNSSAARGQSLKNINPSKWLIAAIYRDKTLIIPQDSTIIKTGDDILVVGHPEVLDTEMNFLRGGQILFPTQYGNSIGAINTEVIGDTVTAMLSKSKADDSTELLFANINPNIHTPAEVRQHLMDNDIGLIVMPPRKVSWFALWGFTKSSMMSIMFNSQIPFLIARGTSNYKKILLAVSKKESISVLATVAMDIVRQFDATLTTVSVFSPNIDKAGHSELEALPAEVENIGGSHGIEVIKQFRDGNPIRQIREMAKDFDLLIVGYAQQNRSTFGNPDISLHIYHKSPCAVLFVPWQTAGR